MKRKQEATSNELAEGRRSSIRSKTPLERECHEAYATKLAAKQAKADGRLSAAEDLWQEYARRVKELKPKLAATREGGVWRRYLDEG